MDGKMLIRSGIFLVAGLAVLIFPKQLMKMQDYILTKIHVKRRDSKKATMVLGIIFLIISIGLFVYSISN
ncbi:hypothetical protein ACFL96_04310 [Thermoproteota archaeon]